MLPPAPLPATGAPQRRSACAWLLAALLGAATWRSSAATATDAQPGLPAPLEPRHRPARARPPAETAVAASGPARSASAAGGSRRKAAADGAAGPAARAASSPDPTTAVAAAVRSWAKAWSRRDAKAYIAAYAPGFISADRLQSYEDWVAQRRAELRDSGTIEIRLENLEFDPKGADWVVSFLQHSQIDGQSASQRKQLLMRRIRGRWLIVGEREDR